MSKLTQTKLLTMAIAIVLSFPGALPAEDPIEAAGETVGMTVGNVLILPVKAISVSIGAISGALSYIVTGNADLTRQIWQDTTQGPYLITPEVAKKAVGERPELS